MRRYPFGTGLVTLVSTEWLAEHLNDETLMVVDVQPNIHDYIFEHISGAVYLSEGLLRGSSKGMPGVYIPRDAAQSVMRQAGIDADRSIVVYTATGAVKGWGDGLEQTMMAYTLARLGHPSVYVLDGGLDKWKEERRALTKRFPSSRASTFTATLRSEFYIEYEELKRIKDRDDVLLLDARPANVYEGQGPWIKPGHIPGAVNLPWASLMHETNKKLLRSDDEIAASIEKVGATKDRLIICSCGTGREATNEFLLFKFYLGYPKVVIYEGSFTEWSSYPENETVTGKDPYAV